MRSRLEKESLPTQSTRTNTSKTARQWAAGCEVVQGQAGTQGHRGQGPLLHGFGHRYAKGWRNRDFILVSAVVCGLALGRGANWTQPLVLPALAVVMTLSTMGVRSEMLRSPRELWRPALSGLLLNYVVLGGILLGLSFLLIREPAMNDGFVLLVAVPPAIAVIPFTEFLRGNTTFSLLATVACYLGALIITPLIALGFWGTSFIEPGTLILVIVELIAAPLLISRVLLRTSVAIRLEPIKGTITNWSFFVVMYTIVGMNRGLFLQRPCDPLLRTGCRFGYPKWQRQTYLQMSAGNRILDPGKI
jgi:hypothetical protein